MANLSNVSDAESAANIYINRLIVFVEGSSDVEIFRRLFPNRESEIKFLSPADSTAKEESSSGEGCMAVIARVTQERADRSNPDRCIGFVDRDIFLRLKNWDLLFETDDLEYRKANPFAEGIIPLTFWEVENYLLVPDVVTMVVADSGKSVVHLERRIRGALVRSLHLNAANCTVHDHGEQAISHGTIFEERDSDGYLELVKEKVRNCLGERYSDEQFDEFIGCIARFRQEDGDEIFPDLPLRVAPGKALVAYLRHHYGIQKIELQLARHIGLQGTVRADLHGDIEQGLSA